MQIHSLVFGEKGTSLVFLHGWQQNSRSFLPLVNFLYQNYRLYFLDLPGFGRSEIPPSSFTSFDYAMEVINWIEKKKLKKIVLIGHSFGGKIASLVCIKKPQLVAKLVLIDSAGISHPKKYYPLLKIIPKKILKIVPEKFKVLISGKDYKEAGSLLPIFKTVVKENIRSLFSNLNVPTLIIWGENDRETPLEDGKIMQKAIKKSTLTVVKDGHFPFWENPQKISSLIENFITNKNINES